MIARALLPLLLAALAALPAHAMSEILNDEALRAVDGNAGVTLGLDATIGGGDLFYINSGNPSQTLYTVINDMHGRVQFSDLKLDIASNTSGQTALMMTLPTQVHFDHFGFQGLYVATNRTVSTPAPPPAPTAFPAWPTPKNYYVVASTYGNCGNAFETCQGQTDPFKLRVTHGNLSAVAGGTFTPETTANTIKPGNQFWEFTSGSAGGAGRDRPPFTNSSDCPGIFSSAPCRNHWVQLTLNYKSIIQIDFGGGNLSTLDNDPYVFVVDADTGLVVATNNNHTVLGFDNLNSQLIMELGPDMTWPSIGLPPPGSDRLLFSMELNGNFRFGGTYEIRP